MRLHLLVIAALLSLTIPLTNAAGSPPEETNQDQHGYLIDRYRLALAVDPDYLPLHYFLGVALLLDRRDAEAITELSRAYPAYTDSVEMHYNLGLAYSRTGDPDSALLYFERAEELGALEQPELYPLADAYFNLGLAYQKSGDTAAAERLFARTLGLEPQRHDIHRLLGDLYASRGETDRALAEFGSYLQAHPDDASVREYIFTLLYNRGLQLLDRNETTEARTSFESALAAVPESPLALYYLGYLDYEEGNLDGAVERLGAALPGAPDDVADSIGGMLYNISRTLLEQRHSSRALGSLGPVLDRPGAPLNVLFLAGNIHLARREFTRARAFYRRVLEVDPTHLGAVKNLIAADAGAVDELFDRGRELYRGGDYRKALEILEQALTINPADTRVRRYAEQAQSDLEAQAEEHFSAAEAALRAGRPEKASEAVRLGIALLPASPRGGELEELILSALAEAMERELLAGRQSLREENFVEAQAAFDRILAIDPGHAEALAGQDAIAENMRAKGAAALRRGEEAIEEGRLADARTALDEALRWQPENEAAKTARLQVEGQIGAVVARELRSGRRALDSGRLERAREHFAAAARLRDDAAIRAELDAVDEAFRRKQEALLAAGRKALTGQDLKQARSLFSQALAVAPDDSRAAAALQDLEARTTETVHRELVAAEQALANSSLREALAHYRQVLDLDPANHQALQGLEAGRGQLAEQLERLTTQGLALLDKGDIQSAEVAFREALALDPYHRETLAGVRRIERLKSAGLNPGDEQRLYLQGIEFYTSGRYDQAVAAWEQLLLLAPNHEKARMNIDKAQRKLSQIREYRGD